MAKPVVALVGRPNVGKSTLFNRLAGERLAVVDDKPGTTRDRLVAEAEWRGLIFDLVDTGGIDPTDLRRWEPLSLDSADYIHQIRAQAEMAARDADVVLFMVDVESGVTTADYEVAEILRKLQRTHEGKLWPPVLLVVNRCDNEKRRAQAAEFYELGMGDPIPISALHGTGTGDLLDLLIEALEGEERQEEEPDLSVKIAIIGRPNVGKSSLLNSLVRRKKLAAVSKTPGRTRNIN
ncbi:MAG TPA: GTP-binding protein, partial [Anaerolineae bacterium]|nr:GTP-binding protein [Anaerolineae bacterium]